MRFPAVMQDVRFIEQKKTSMTSKKAHWSNRWKEELFKISVFKFLKY